MQKSSDSVQHGIRAHAAVDHVLPHQHSQPVAVIVPAHRLQFYMLSKHVEAELFHLCDVEDHRLVAGRSIQPVGPVTLVQKPVVEIGFVIQFKAHHARVVLAHRKLAHSEIGNDDVLVHDDDKVVKRGILGRPQFVVFEFQRAFPVYQTAFRHDFVARVSHGFARGIGGVGQHSDLKRVGIDVRGQIHCGNVHVGHAFQPHRLPYARLRSIEYTAAF